MTHKKGSSWKDMTTGERKAVLVGWVVVVAVGAYFLWPADSAEPIKEPAQSQVALAATVPPTYLVGTTEAQTRANAYFADIDKAMGHGIEVLKSQDVKSVGEHSRRFSALADQGKALFGATFAEPLGYCGMAGNYARTWWHAQVGAAMKGGVEATPGEIQSGLQEYQLKRKDCLSTITEGIETNG